MQTIELLKNLESYPLFTINDISKIINKNSEYCRTLLNRLKKKKYIIKIERGKYTTHKDPIIFSSYIMLPSYVGLWTALKFYNLTEQQPQTITIVSKKKRKDIIINKTKISFNSTKQIFGYIKYRYGDFDILISDKEKTIIDSLLFRLPIDIIINAIKYNNLNKNKLIEYAKKTNNKSLIKRLGFLLEENKINLDIKTNDNNYIPLNYSKKNKGKKNKKWRIIDNR